MTAEGMSHLLMLSFLACGWKCNTLIRSKQRSKRDMESCTEPLLLSIVLTLGRTWRALWAITKAWPGGKDEGTG